MNDLPPDSSSQFVLPAPSANVSSSDDRPIVTGLGVDNQSGGGGPMRRDQGTEPPRTQARRRGGRKRGSKKKAQHQANRDIPFHTGHPYPDIGSGKRDYGFPPYSSASHSRPAVAPKAPSGRTSRTIYLNNIPSTLSCGELETYYKSLGDIKSFKDFAIQNGTAYVTFFDIRVAESAVENNHGAFPKNLGVKVHYAPPSEDEEPGTCDRTKNQGTLLYTLKNSKNGLDDNRLMAYLSQYGNVRVIRKANFKRKGADGDQDRRQRLVEFYDSRHCVRAYDETYNQEYEGGRWDVAFFWDHRSKKGKSANELVQDHFHGDNPQHRPPIPASQSEWDNGRSRPTVPAISGANAIPIPNIQHSERPVMLPQDNVQKAQQLLAVLAQLQSKQPLQQPTPAALLPLSSSPVAPVMPLSTPLTVPHTSPQSENFKTVCTLLGLLKQQMEQLRQLQQQ